MSKKNKTAIIPTRAEDFPTWYQEVIKAADLAENAPVRGCMTIKPYGFALWENIQRIFDGWLKDYGIQNCAFPMLIPVEFLAKEAEHVEGFAKECAVVTHHRLEADPDKGGLRPAPEAKLEEPYVVRPTSETIIGDAMSRWIQSYRDLPMKLNQWGSVMRWEMRTRMFLRTSEFFWHEGHNAFENHEGAKGDCLHVLDLYKKFFEEYLAIPGIQGIKTADERFPGANETYCIESMMQDGKALQAATTHDLGTNFAKSFEIKYQDREGQEQYAHTTSWAFSSRIIGAMIMVHGDDDGMIMPPRIAPHQIVIVPIIRDDADSDKILNYANDLKAKLKEQGIRAHLDDSEARTPDKMWGAIKKGVPLRVEIGGREMEEGTLTHVRRDLGRDSKATCDLGEFLEGVGGILDDIHDAMYARALAFRDENSRELSSLADIENHFKGEGAGFVKIDAALLDNPEYARITKDLGLSSRCLPFEDDGKKAIIGKAY